MAPKKKELRILFGVPELSDGKPMDISWQARFPAHWQDPLSPRLLAIAGKPHADVRPQAKLMFRDRNKPVFAATWHTNAFIQVYDPKSSDKNAIIKHLKAIGMDDLPVPDSPGTICTWHSFTPPKSLSKIKTEALLRQGHDVKPDWDNIVKFHMDVLQTGIIPTDQRISTGLTHKFYGEVPGTMVYYHPGDFMAALKLGLRYGAIFTEYACPARTLAL